MKRLDITPELLKATEVMAMLEVSGPTILRWEKKGTLKPLTLPHSRMKWYRRNDILSLLTPLIKKSA